MRKCCGYYCAMIAVVAIFFYAVVIVMEVRKNNYVMYKMQFPETAAALEKIKDTNSTYVLQYLEEEADAKVVPLIIAIGLNVVCAIGCIVQVKLLEKKEKLAALAHADHDEFEHMGEEVKFD
jgi:hypothetical protein